MNDRTLIIDTTTPACSVALIEGPEKGLGDRYEVIGRGHAERLIPMIATLPDGGRAGHILVDVGPGSFTGIRVGIAAARGLALGWGASVAGYSSLSLVAMDYFLFGQHGPAFAIVIEGGHGEVFMQRFAGRPDFQALDEPASLTPADAIARLDGMEAVGSGVERLVDLPANQRGPALLPWALLARELPPAYKTLPPIPFYGRAPDATPAAPRAG